MCMVLWSILPGPFVKSSKISSILQYAIPAIAGMAQTLHIIVICPTVNHAFSQLLSITITTQYIVVTNWRDSQTVMEGPPYYTVLVDFPSLMTLTYYHGIDVDNCFTSDACMFKQSLLRYGFVQIAYSFIIFLCKITVNLPCTDMFF